MPPSVFGYPKGMCGIPELRQAMAQLLQVTGAAALQPPRTGMSGLTEPRLPPACRAGAFMHASNTPHPAPPPHPTPHPPTSRLQDSFMAGLAVDPDHLCVSAGAGSVIDVLFHCIASSGEGALIPVPYYPAFDNDLQVRLGFEGGERRQRRAVRLLCLMPGRAGGAAVWQLIYGSPLVPPGPLGTPCACPPPPLHPLTPSSAALQVRAGVQQVPFDLDIEGGPSSAGPPACSGAGARWRPGAPARCAQRSGLQRHRGI
jgi:hypothetical protein